MNLMQEQKPGSLIIDKPDWRWIAGLLVAGVLLGGIVVGIFFALKMKYASDDCAAKITAAQKSGTEAGVPNVPKVNVPDEVNNISGTIEKVDGNTLTVKTFFFGEPKNYSVTVANDTKIIKREIIEGSLKAANEKEPPAPFKDSDAKLSDIREKDNVSIDSADNIKDKTAFEAKTIYIQISNLPAPPAVTTPSVPEGAPAAPSVDTSKFTPAPPAPAVPSNLPPAPPAPSVSK